MMTKNADKKREQMMMFSMDDSKRPIRGCIEISGCCM